MYGRKACSSQASGFELCVGAGDECSTVGSLDQCDADTLVYCDDGYVARADCKALGFSKCSIIKDIHRNPLGAICE
ncbi:MAG: hypothetical protein H6707_01015 [Deltaproteobacteria bacterium]|nr:hypothetical protein [Deltaproteobacteria bacterium]